MPSTRSSTNEGLASSISKREVGTRYLHGKSCQEPFLCKNASTTTIARYFALRSSLRSTGPFSQGRPYHPFSLVHSPACSYVSRGAPRFGSGLCPADGWQRTGLKRVEGHECWTGIIPVLIQPRSVQSFAGVHPGRAACSGWEDGALQQPMVERQHWL